MGGFFQTDAADEEGIFGERIFGIGLGEIGEAGGGVAEAAGVHVDLGDEVGGGSGDDFRRGAERTFSAARLASAASPRS